MEQVDDCLEVTRLTEELPPTLRELSIIIKTLAAPSPPPHHPYHPHHHNQQVPSYLQSRRLAKGVFLLPVQHHSDLPL